MNGFASAQNVERFRLGLAAIWLYAALYTAIDLNLTWRTGLLFVGLGLVPPVALFGFHRSS